MTAIDFPELGLIVMTRAMAGFGAGLLIAPRLNDDQRKAIGLTLLVVGAVTTIPIIAHLRNEHREPGRASSPRRSRSLASPQV